MGDIINMKYYTLEISFDFHDQSIATKEDRDKFFKEIREFAWERLYTDSVQFIDEDTGATIDAFGREL